MKNALIISIGLMLWVASTSFGYMEDYPPYKFKDGLQAHLNIKPLVSDSGDYRSKDGRVVIHLKEPKPFEVEFYLKAGEVMLASSDKQDVFPCSVFQVDLDNNSLDDFIVFYNYRGTGLAARQDRVEIFLQKDGNRFEKITYDTFDAGIEDFIGPDNQGRYNVIITGFYGGVKHNYFTYNIYEFLNYNLVNIDAKVKDFPKFVQYTYKDNDRDTSKLTAKERLFHTQEKDNSIIRSSVRCAGEVAPELAPEEEHFAYEEYRDKVQLIRNTLCEYEKGKRYDSSLEENYIGIPNSLLALEGYGLCTQKEILRLKLENAKLRNEPKEAIANLKKQFETADKQLKTFLSENSWVD